MDKWDHRFLLQAAAISSWSKDSSTKVGAIIVRPDRTIAAQGFNGLPRGVADLPERYENRELKYKIIVHGEMNAILTAREPLHGYTLYTWPFMPCSNCASMVIQAGLARVVSVANDNPRWAEAFKLTRQLFYEAGVELQLHSEDEIRFAVAQG